MLNADCQVRMTRTFLQPSGTRLTHLAYLCACFILVFSFADSSRGDDLWNDSPREIHSSVRMQWGSDLGSFKLRVAKLLSCFEQDPNIVAGTEVLQAGQKLDAENTKEAHLKAIEKYAEA